MSRYPLSAASLPLVAAVMLVIGFPLQAVTQDDTLKTGVHGKTGGSLTVALRTEPKTLNPVLSVDAASREVIGAIQADLIHINRETQRTEPALATEWKISPDGKRYTLRLRRGVKFSDGAPFDADDVLFSFKLYLDEKLNSPQRDLLLFDDKPLTVTKLDPYTVRFDLPRPYGAGVRLFDGLAMMPRHLLETPYHEGRLAQMWAVNSPAGALAGLGPFHLKEYVPGQRLVLERNPNYWKTDAQGVRLPYLSQLIFSVVTSEDAQVAGLQRGEADIVERLRADDYSVLQRDAQKRVCLRDLGPGLESIFLFFNMNHLDPAKQPDLAPKQEWFRELRFRQAVSLAMDRKGMARLVYGGLATPIWTSATPGNKLWLNAALPHPERSIEKGRALLQSAGFRWDSQGQLLDAHSRPVAFTILVSSSNAQRSRLATLAVDDLKQLGMDVQVVPMEFRALVDRVLNTKNYEAVLMNIVNGDADPTPEMNLWLSSGEMHLWDLGEAQPATPWEAEIDSLMRAQLIATSFAARKQAYDRVQELVSQNLPLIFLLSPNILVGARPVVGNFRPAVLEPYALWNADQLFVRPAGSATCQ